MRMSDEVFKKFGKTFRKGEIVCKEGDIGDEMYIIHSGKIAITKMSRDLETTLAVLTDGEFFGEMAIIDNQPRSATAKAMDYSKLIVLSAEIFETQISTNPKLIMRILRKMSNRLREADRKIKTLLYRDNSSRVTGTLMLLTQKHGEPQVGGGIKLEKAFTVKELVGMVGLPKPKVEEILDTLVRARVIEMKDEVMTVYSMEHLERFMNYLEMKEQFGDV
ncbi:Crp/Fnr family transcriptional regulator [bacterium]|nr:Crp/Fnr family transcriptional regulator [bacterium]